MLGTFDALERAARLPLRAALPGLVLDGIMAVDRSRCEDTVAVDDAAGSLYKMNCGVGQVTETHVHKGTIGRGLGAGTSMRDSAVSAGSVDQLQSTIELMHVIASTTRSFPAQETLAHNVTALLTMGTAMPSAQEYTETLPKLPMLPRDVAVVGLFNGTPILWDILLHLSRFRMAFKVCFDVVVTLLANNLGKWNTVATVRGDQPSFANPMLRDHFKAAASKLARPYRTWPGQLDLLNKTCAVVEMIRNAGFLALATGAECAIGELAPVVTTNELIRLLRGLFSALEEASTNHRKIEVRCAGALVESLYQSHAPV